MSKIVKRLTILATGCLGAIAISASVIAVRGHTYRYRACPTGVVFGNKVELTGLPSNRLKARLEKARDLYREGAIATIIVSGGIGKEGFDEAQVMKDYLVSQNIDANRIIADNQGVNTLKTIEFVEHYLNDNDCVIMISQHYHLPRIEVMMKKKGITGYLAKADYYEMRDIYSLFREIPALIKYSLF
jgi:vancomycin permeability regulator SanA